MRIRTRATVAVFVAIITSAASAQAGDVLAISDVKVDPPTLHALGVQVLISGDDNRNAKIGVRVRPQGATTWRNGLPLLRVMPETVRGLSVPQQFGGSVFDLQPDAPYEIELHAIDPDGSVDVLKNIVARTKAMPHDPKTPREVKVANEADLRAALAAAKPGDVITIAKGTYKGSYSLGKSGTSDDPIVLRGEDEETTIFDADPSVNNWEIYGGFVHLERMTLQGGGHAARFFPSAENDGVVARRLHIKNVWQGIWISGDDQKNIYVCDNVIEGLDVWPWVYDADATSHWDDEAIQIHGEGVDVCHNKIVGFGDTIIQKKLGARSFDFYGNDISDSWDGTELEEGAGNIRLFNNRWTNVFDGLSMQPVYGGPAYVMRNVIYNPVGEQMKIHAEGDGAGGFKEPSGMLVFHNTFVSPSIALTDETPAQIHNFIMNNNVFVGPRKLAGARTVEYTTPIDHGMFDYDGYFPDGTFWLGAVAGSNVLGDNFAALQAGGVFESRGVLLDDKVFANGQVGPDDPKTKHPPFDATLSATSGAKDKGVVLPGINEGFRGSAPDLGAIELGCAPPVYGPRPEGSEAIEAPVDCSEATPPAGDAGPSGDSGGDGSIAPGGDGAPQSDSSIGDDAGTTGDAPNEETSGCGCTTSPSRSPCGVLVAASLAIVYAARSRRAGVVARSSA